MLKLHTGPSFQFARQLGSALCVVTLAAVYGPAMPLAWMFGALYFVVTYASQRLALMRLHRLPKLAFDDRVVLRLVPWCKFVILLHILGTYCAFRQLPCVKLEEVYLPRTSADLQATTWLFPLIAQRGAWLNADAWRQDAPAAPPAAPPTEREPQLYDAGYWDW